MSQDKQFRLIIACGGTGGHIFPAVAMADVLRQKDPDVEILFAGVFAPAMQALLKDKDYDVCCTKVSAMPRSFNFLVVPFIVKLLFSLKEAFFILKSYLPDVVLSMGSFSGGPFVVAAKLSGLPVIIHEQNVVPGRANKLSAHFADKIAVSFEATAGFLSGRARKKIAYTGNPARKEILAQDRAKALETFGFKNDKFTLMVMGGSQGARKINSVFSLIAKKLDKEKFQILHFTGEYDHYFVQEAYNKAGITNKVFTFFNNMGMAYAVCDLAVCRSGATTVSEITLAGIASILIPYPYGDAHQKENAKVLKDAGAAFVIEEKYLTAEKLFECIKKFSHNTRLLEGMRVKSRILANPQAAERLAQEVLLLAKVMA